MVYLRRYTSVSVILLFLLFCQPGCVNRGEQSEARQVRTNVEVWKVATSRMLDEVSLPGLVEPVQTVTISSEVSGRAESVRVEEGDEVGKNQMLLVADRTELALMVDQAAARVREVDALLREIKAGARPETLAQLRAAVDSARSARDLAADQAKRREKLFKDGVVAKEMYEATKTSLTAAEKRLEQAEESYKLAKKGATKETIEINEARLASAITTHELAKKTLEKTEIRSPQAGVINRKFIEEGELLSPGKKLFEIITADKVKVVVWVPERVMTKVRTGDAVKLHFDALENTVSAPVSRIAFAADETTRTFKIEILLDNPRLNGTDGPVDRKYRVGYIASAAFKVAEVPEAVRVPIEALVLQGMRTIVFSVRKADSGEMAVAANDVELGLKNRHSIQVLSGIAPGDIIVVKGQRFVRDGEAVEVVKTHEGSWPW